MAVLNQEGPFPEKSTCFKFFKCSTPRSVAPSLSSLWTTGKQTESKKQEEDYKNTLPDPPKATLQKAQPSTIKDESNECAKGEPSRQQASHKQNHWSPQPADDGSHDSNHNGQDHTSPAEGQQRAIKDLGDIFDSPEKAWHCPFCPAAFNTAPSIQDHNRDECDAFLGATLMETSSRGNLQQAWDMKPVTSGSQNPGGDTANTMPSEELHSRSENNTEEHPPQSPLGAELEQRPQYPSNASKSGPVHPTAQGGEESSESSDDSME